MKLSDHRKTHRTAIVGSEIFKSILIVFFILFVFAFALNAQCVEKNDRFQWGEKIDYQVYYNWHFIWMNAGHVSFSVKKKTYRSLPVYHFFSTGNTYGKYDFFYTVRDTFESFVDTATLAPLLAMRKSNEGGSSVYESYRFEKSKGRIFSRLKKDDEAEIISEIVWQDCTVDVLTMVYWARNIEFLKYKKGDRIPIRMVVDGKIHDLYIIFQGRDIVETKEGRRFRCLKFTPLLMEGTLFEAGDDMTVWVTDDENRMPILVEAKVLVGSVKAMFYNAKALRYPIKAEIFDK
ncbi:MAG: DUF3108 domain-containing protein [Marinilabiliaceae bacterium]|nr:DUF3108 domain-containing protein [Marinilabiliaceae bacterium]